MQNAQELVTVGVGPRVIALRADGGSQPVAEIRRLIEESNRTFEAFKKANDESSST